MVVDQLDVVVPLFGLNSSGKPKTFLGSSFFVGDPPLLITAEHVVRDWPGELGIVVLKQLDLVYRATLLEKDRAHDLAVLQVEGYSPPQALDPGYNEPVHANTQLMTFEYGTTVVAGRSIDLNPATRIGNRTRVLNLTKRLGPAGEEALELSFPALRGASGAPVIMLNPRGGFSAVGVVVANVSYHLLPAQIESVLDESNQLLEETKYVLPQGVAVNLKHLEPLVLRARERHGA